MKWAGVGPPRERGESRSPGHPISLSGFVMNALLSHTCDRAFVNIEELFPGYEGPGVKTRRLSSI